jgi:predicted Zn-dependent protease
MDFIRAPAEHVVFARHQRSQTMLVRALTAATLSLMLAACSTNPATGKSQFNALSREQEIAIGEEAMPQLIEEFGGEIPSARVQAYVDEIGARIAANTESDYPGLPWEFTALNGPEINAFALPGGKVFVSRGMLEAMANEAQLAGVLAHEIGHVTARHINERYSQELGIGLGASIVGAVLGDGGATSQIVGAASQLGSGLVLLSFNRDQELEADTLGMRYMSLTGYDPYGMLQMMQILASQGGGGGGPEFFSTHPHPETRIESIQRELSQNYGHTQGNTEFRLYPERYQERMLRELPAARGQSGGGRLMERVALGDPAGWCAHCAAGVH